MSLRTRLTMWYSGVLAITLLAFGVALYFFLSYTTFANIERNLRQQGEEFVSQIRVIPFFSMEVIQLPELNNFRMAETFLQTNRVDGKIDRSDNFPRMEQLPFNRETDFAKAQKDKSWFRTYTSGDTKLLIYHTRMVYKEQLIGVLQVATVVSDEYAFLHDLRNMLILFSVFAVILAASLGYYLARKALQPIEHVITAANRIERGEDLAKRITHDGPKDEIARLTDTINKMLGRIETTYKELDEAYRHQRQFVSDASHELRTPLTTIRGNVELLEKMWEQGGEGGDQSLSMEAMRDISSEAARMSRLVSDLLALARADAGHQITKSPVEMREILDEVVRKAEFLPHKVPLQVGDLSEAVGAVINGNADYLQQVLFILLENAFKYTNEGYVRLDALRRQGQIGIRIEDTGIGMKQEEIPRIFDRFYRADTSRGVTSGTGLGLSIARWIIDEHQGSMEVMSRVGQGTVFIVWFPIVPVYSDGE